MKKKFLNLAVLAFFLGGVQTTNAQNWRNAPQFHLGVRGGVSSTNAIDANWDGDDESSSLSAPTFGIAFDTKVAKIPFYIETGLYYMNRGYNDSGFDYGGNNHKRWHEVFNNRSLLVPALISYHAYAGSNVAIQPFMGPFISYGFDEELFDSGGRFGCGVSVKKFYANVGFDLSFNIVGSVFATVGWNFLGKR